MPILQPGSFPFLSPSPSPCARLVSISEETIPTALFCAAIPWCVALFPLVHCCKVTYSTLGIIRFSPCAKSCVSCLYRGSLVLLILFHLRRFAAQFRYRRSFSRFLPSFLPHRIAPGGYKSVTIRRRRGICLNIIYLALSSVALRDSFAGFSWNL